MPLIVAAVIFLSLAAPGFLGRFLAGAAIGGSVLVFLLYVAPLLSR